MNTMNTTIHANGTISRRTGNTSRDIASVSFDGGRKWLHLIQVDQWTSTGVDVQHLWHDHDALIALVDAEREKRNMRAVARIFDDVGGYYVCSDAINPTCSVTGGRKRYLAARGRCYPTKAAAMRAAAEMGYTHCAGSGTYYDGVRAIPLAYR